MSDVTANYKDSAVCKSEFKVTSHFNQPYIFVVVGCHPLAASSVNFISTGSNGDVGSFLGSGFTIG